MKDYSSETVTLMFGDVEVMRYNFVHGIYDVINPKYMPYGLRNRINDTLCIIKREGIDSTESVRRYRHSNQNGIVYWFASRTLSLSRVNAGKIHDLLGAEQKDDEYTKYNMSLMCRGVSVLDKYWVKFNDEEISWEDVNMRKNDINDIIGQVALHGDIIEFKGSYSTPEVNTNGVYAKAWRRHDDGSLWLHKLGMGGGDQSRIEVMVSDILDKCNVSHVKYIGGTDCGEYVCMCPCMTTDDYSIISAYEFRRYCSYSNIDFIDETLRLDTENYYKMRIVDYLICNNDRHLHNWGFLMNNGTMQIESLHPLFDHNNAFDSKLMPNQRNCADYSYKEMRRKAEFAMGEVDFHFTAPICEEDFLETKYYDAFMQHAEELGVKVIATPSPFEAALKKMNN